MWTDERIISELQSLFGDAGVTVNSHVAYTMLPIMRRMRDELATGQPEAMERIVVAMERQAAALEKLASVVATDVGGSYICQSSIDM